MSNQPPTTDFIAEFWNEFHRQAVRNQLANASTTEVNKMNAADAIKHSRRHARVNAAINNIRSHIMDAITSGEPSMKITCSTDWPAWLNAELTKNDFETIGETFNAEGYQVTIIEGEHITIVWDNDTLATTTGFTDEQPSASDVAGFIGQSSPPVKMFVDQIEDRMRESTQADSGPFFISYTAVSDHIKAEDGIKAVIKEIESRGFEADDDTSAQMIVVRKLSGELAHARAMLDTGKIDTSHKPDSVATVHSDGSFDLTPINENIVNRAVNAVRAAARAGELGIEQLKQAANASG
ncbi:MAG TPA: hypothetical protein PK402_11180, partial [Tepidisphaeraceae bacterium]|nr:hypothetical protein [Tepidisphaeraceae bacterium]